MLPERVLRKIEKEKGGCWIWTGAKNEHGYGIIRVTLAPKKSVNRRVHRFVYEALVGPIPEGLQLDHLCRVRACCNPEHLEPVTNQENGLRGNARFNGENHRQKTHCPQGHPYTEANTYRPPGRNERQCKICRREAVDRYIKKRKEE